MNQWIGALQAFFGEQWRTLAAGVGSGLRQLLATSSDMEEAVHVFNNGLLLATPTTIDLLASESERLLADVIEPLEHVARE